ncbi:MAG TPA: glutamate--tRNA ligase [Thermoplasmata archaeon]|nr:glutamate--tRNA ligase [Thermoplasmata archaeon]
MALPEEAERRARRLALQNAVEHGGAPRAGPIVSRLLAQDGALRPMSSEVAAEVKRIVTEVAALSADAQREALEALGGPEEARPRPAPASGELPPLPGAVSGAVVLRMAPFPSGALHIGHTRMIYVNDAYRTMYNGRLLLVIDDTPGSEEKRVDPEMIEGIRRDLDLAKIPVDATLYKSDRVPMFYPWARRVIDRGAAYVCHCPAPTLRQNRADGVECPERDQSVAETVEEWERMLAGAFAPGEAVLRLRTDLRDPDPAFRDRVMFRISDLDHPRVGHRYRVWPMLEFSWAVDDVDLGITHVIRGKDLVIEDRMEEAIWKVLGIQGPRFAHWGILRVKEAKVSKSKSYAEVRSGQYDGWADPRTWSLLSLDRRGILPEAIRRFTLSFGLSLADIEVPAETLYAENRQLIDATTPRRAFVEDPVLLKIGEFPPDLTAVELPNHPDRSELGVRRVEVGSEMWVARSDATAHLGAEIRLKELVNVRLPDSIPDAPRPTLEAMFTSRENRRLPRIQWVGARGAVDVDMLGVEGEHHRGLGESALLAARPRDHLQFERVGFVRVEGDWTPGVAPVRVCFGHP